MMLARMCDVGGIGIEDLILVLSIYMCDVILEYGHGYCDCLCGALCPCYDQRVYIYGMILLVV